MTLRTADARRRFQQALAMVQGSGASDELKADARLRHSLNVARAAIRERDFASARRLAERFADSAAASGNPDRTRQGEELRGLLALAQRDAETALARLRGADQHDPFILYAQAQALALKGAEAEARDLFAKVASYNDLPTLRYAMVRRSAAREAGAR